MQSLRKLLISTSAAAVLIQAALFNSPQFSEAALSITSPAHEESASGETANADMTAIEQVQALIPTSQQLVEGAVAVLAKGWGRMSQVEREAFLALYDPSGSGEIDDEFVETVLSNYQRIQEELDGEITIVYEPDSSRCEDMRLYYTDLVKLHVCPYYLTEENEIRKARTLIHEMAHLALHVVDRPYYRPTNQEYAQLTPNGSWMAQLPVIGRLIREIQHSDTLYHPDAYAHFTVAVSGQPVAEDMYVGHPQSTATVSELGSTSLAAETQVVDSWAFGSGG